MARISPRVQHLKERHCPIQSPSSSNPSLNGHARIQAPRASHFSMSGTGKSKPPFFMTILPYGQHKTHLPQPVQRIEATISATLFKDISILLVLLKASRPVKSNSCFSFARPSCRKDPVYPLHCTR